MGVRMRAWVTAVVWAWVVLLATPCAAMSMQRQQEEEEEALGIRHMLEAINRVSQALETHERHTSLYERVALLETSLAERTERAMVLQAEVTQLRAKIPELEAEIETIPEMRKELAEFEAKIEKLVQDYEAKLSTLASEVIRLKKSGARRKDLLTLSDGSNVLLRPAAQSCPEVGQGMVAERIGEHCLYFSFGERQNWTASYDHCQQLGAEMAASQVLQPLKQFLRQAFARGPSLWLGSSFNLSDHNEAREAEDESEDGDTSGHSVKVSSEDPELTSDLPPSQDLSHAFQADGVIGFPDSGAEQGLSNPFTLNLKEGPLEDMEEEISGPAGSLRGILDQVPMFQDDILASYRSRFLADEPSEDPPPVEENERAPENSVVDIVLLTGPADDEGRQDIEVHVPSNQTEAGSREAAAGPSQGGGVVPGEGRGVEEALGPMQEAGKTMESGKSRMKCMLLQQSESQEYEVVGRPCDEQHSFVCDIKVTIDSLLPEW